MKLNITYGQNNRGYNYGFDDYSIILGVVPEGEHTSDCNWANKGNQIDIGNELNSRRKIRVHSDC